MYGNNHLRYCMLGSSDTKVPRIRSKLKFYFPFKKEEPCICKLPMAQVGVSLLPLPDPLTRLFTAHAHSPS